MGRTGPPGRCPARAAAAVRGPPAPPTLGGGTASSEPAVGGMAASDLRPRRPLAIMLAAAVPLEPSHRPPPAACCACACVAAATAAGATAGAAFGAAAIGAATCGVGDARAGVPGAEAETGTAVAAAAAPSAVVESAIAPDASGVSRMGRRGRSNVFCHPAAHEYGALRTYQQSGARDMCSQPLRFSGGGCRDLAGVSDRLQGSAARTTAPR
jgi:hypothetical protein